MLTLTYYGLLRFRHRRSTPAALLALAVVGALVSCVLRGPEAHRFCAWLFPAVFAVAAALVVWLRQASDRASGLAAAIACSPVTASQVLWSRVLTGVTLFAVQMAVYRVALAVCL